MNRFRTKKKGKDEDGAPRPSQDSESSMPFRGFRKGKKSQETEKKPVDIATVLPSNDDFRTSLLMTGLSARFSMLREQDDPNTKIGKASDDSVLFPKRQSRMDLTSFRGLGDIAEVESIKAASPFARMDSYHSDDADSLKAGSIMSRAKPTEGNNLFGGRQKIYKIPASAGSSRTVDGGLSGRVLYDDDVAQSAFQKWRRAEKEREPPQEEPDGDDEFGHRHSSTDVDPRSESPALSSYNRKRETSSTLSSIPSIARNSSAATSITSSHPTSSLKDWQPPSSSSSGPERSVTRTRRLYETGFFNNDAQESATGSLSRMDTLNRQRPFGPKTPELNQHSPSLGTLNGVSDRLSGERRLLAKGSAPNLRSMSPPASASSTGTPDLGIRVPSAGESRPSFGAPPLSPPISEADENAILPINPNDRGKATALGVFRKPAQPYDESRYAQRQLQLQRGRETPTQRRSGDEPNPPAPISRSRSPSPTRKDAVDSPTAPVFPVTQSPVREQIQPTSFLADSDESETSSIVSSRPLPSPQVYLRRPSDREHPAFRDSALPTPLSLMKPHDEPSPITETSSSLLVESKGVSPEDSPTLGPVTDSSGLSGMVRQHLRGNSNASSIYEGVPPTAALESRFPAETANSKPLQDYGASSNPWEGEDHGHDWNLDLDVNEPLPDAESVTSVSGRPTETKTDLSLAKREGTDEFANQLADGARRVRERLTTYVETDSRSSSPHRVGEQKDASDMAPLPRPGGLGAILRPKSSKGSLVDRGRDPSSARAFKMMGISPGGSRTGSPGSESLKGQVEVEGELGQEREQEKGTSQGADDQHPGLRAFRQARRELQRLKEVETQSRHYPAPQGPPPDVPSPQPRNAREPGAPRTRTPSRDRKPPPVYYQQRIPSEEYRNGDSPPNSQVSSWNDRQRSESESSNGIRSNNRSARPEDGLGARENMHLGPTGLAPRPAMRSPGLPGTDIKRSHIMPPQLHPNTSSRMNQSNFTSNGNLQAPRGYESVQPSPISPNGSPFVNSAPATPVTLSPPRPPVGQSLSYDNSTVPISGVNDSMRRKVRPRDISEPTFVMSTSRVPTVALPPEAEGNRSRSNSRAAPPLPPINPRRRQDSTKVRTMLDSFARYGRDSDATASTPNLPLGEPTNGAGRRGTITGSDEDEPRTNMRRPQRAMADAANMNTNFNMPRGNGSPINVGPPASRMVVTQGRNRPGNTRLPGGMI
ncbi:hypothetical protein HD806DRAFT_207710 [Xylariaceae sp. AK1471]|nr:hypothetical protein HD806DRAFT_207710 [Xylariaceae sp. AK1471]